MTTSSRKTLSLLLCLSILLCLFTCSAAGKHKAPALWDEATGPVYQDVKQRDWGDCWLDATISSIAFADQEYLKQMIHRDPTDSHRAIVYFYYKTALQTITIKMDQTKPHNDANSNMWPAVLEQAFVALGKHHPDLGIHENLNGWGIVEAFQAMYDETRTSITTVIPRVDSDEKLWAMWNQAANHPTVSGTLRETKLGLKGNHAFSAIGCDQDKGMVTLRNPWGIVSRDKLSKKVKKHKDGVFDIPFDEWKKDFFFLIASAPKE